MKKRIYLLLYAVLPLAVVPQKYQPLDSTVVWSTRRISKQGGGGCAMETRSRYYMKGYSLNNGRVWNKLYESGHSWLNGMCGSMFPDPPFNDVLYGYIYNDSLNRMVYYVSNLTANYTPVIADILYDFNKAVGDTIFINPYSLKFRVDSIDSLLFSNKYHKRYHTADVAGTSLQSIDVTFTEGIGSSVGPFVHSSFFESYSELLCFAGPSQTMTIWNFSTYTDGYCAGLVIGVDEEEKHVQEVYPNPFQRSLMVDLPATEVRIYDTEGRLVLEQQTSGGKDHLETGFLSPGIYFLKAGEVSRKVIKE